MAQYIYEGGGCASGVGGKKWSASIPEPTALFYSRRALVSRSRRRGNLIVGLSMTEKLIVRLMKTLRESSSARLSCLSIKYAPQTGS